MNLGDLEFKPEDFVFKGDVKAAMEYHPDWIARCVADQANRLLRKKLAKAPEVFGRGYGELLPRDWGSRLPGADTHRARLVCIEEIEK